MRCPLCTSLQSASPLSTIRNPATGSLPALYLTPSRVSLLKRSQNSYPRVACSPPLSNTHLPFQPLAIQLQVRHALSISLRRASPFSQPLSYPATGPLPVLCLSPMRISISTASCSATVVLPAVFFSPSPHLSFPLPSIWTLVRCPHSALLRRASLPLRNAFLFCITSHPGDKCTIRSVYLPRASIFSIASYISPDPCVVE